MPRFYRRRTSANTVEFHADGTTVAATAMTPMKRFPAKKPILLLTLLFLLAGAVVNVAVAFVASVWCVELRAQDPRESLDSWFAPLPLWAQRSEPDYASQVASVLADESFGLVMCSPAASPHDGHWFAAEQGLIRVGWPCRAFEGVRSAILPTEFLGTRFVGTGPQAPLVGPSIEEWTWSRGDFGVDLPTNWPGQTANGMRVVSFFPCAPVPLGIAADSVFFGALLAGLCLGPFALRRWARRKRGACVACGYSLRGHPAAGVCPECGHAAARPGLEG